MPFKSAHLRIVEIYLCLGVTFSSRIVQERSLQSARFEIVGCPQMCWIYLEPPNVLDLLGSPKCVGFRFCDTLKNPSHKMQFQMVDPSAWKSVLAFVWLLQAPLLLRLRCLLRLRWRLCHDRRGSSTDPQYTQSSVYVRWSASLKLLYMRLKIYEKQNDSHAN